MPSALTQSAPQLQRWNTLQLLKTSRIVLLALDALLLGAVLIGADVHRHAMQIIGNDTAPSIIAAQHIKAALADMDADLANELMVPAGQAVPSPGAYDDRRVEAAKALIVAAGNITFGDSERLPIESLQVTTGTYERLAQQSRDLADAGQAEMSTRFYRAAGIVMDGTVLPSADDLDKANNDVLEREYESKSTSSFVARLFVGLAGLLALSALAAAQLYLSRRTRRTLNPALLGATVLVLWLTGYAFAGMGSEEHDLKVARQDAFTSVRALWQARALAYSANGAESRSLLDPAHAGEYEGEFVARSSALARIPPSLSAARVVAAARAGSTTPGFTGFLADELNNITFQGEREAAAQTLEKWESYMAVAGQIQALERSGQHQRAIELCIGTVPGESNWAFAQFDKALQATLDINQQAFAAAVADGFSAVKGMELKAGAVAVLIAILVLIGLAPRIREYE